MNPLYSNVLQGLLQHFLMFAVGTSFFMLLGFRAFFGIRIIFVRKLLQQTILLGQLLLVFKPGQLEIEIIWWLQPFQVLLVSHYTSLSSAQTTMLLMWSCLQYLFSLFRYPVYTFSHSIKGEFHSLCVFFLCVCLPPLCSRNSGLTVPLVLTSHACFLLWPWFNPRLCLNCFQKHVSVIICFGSGKK